MTPPASPGRTRPGTMPAAGYQPRRRLSVTRPGPAALTWSRASWARSSSGTAGRSRSEPALGGSPRIAHRSTASALGSSTARQVFRDGHAVAEDGSQHPVAGGAGLKQRRELQVPRRSRRRSRRTRPVPAPTPGSSRRLPPTPSPGGPRPPARRTRSPTPRWPHGRWPAPSPRSPRPTPGTAARYQQVRLVRVLHDSRWHASRPGVETISAPPGPSAPGTGVVAGERPGDDSLLVTIDCGRQVGTCSIESVIVRETARVCVRYQDCPHGPEPSRSISQLSLGRDIEGGTAKVGAGCDEVDG